MAKSKAPKNLEVDGTDKLAARSKQNDKHEKANLNIEEATVASPRASRKRAGDYFDFDGADSEAEAPLGKVDVLESGKSKKKTKLAKTARTEKPSPDEAKLKIKETKAKDAEDDATEVIEGKPSKAVNGKQAEAQKDEASSSKEKKRNRQKSGKAGDATGEPVPGAVAAKPKGRPKKSGDVGDATADSVHEAAAAKPKGRPKKSKPAAEEDAGPSATIDADVAMDEGPFESLLEKEQGTEPAQADKPAKKSAKGSKAPKTKSTKVAAADSVAEVADTAKEVVEDGVGKAKKTAKDNAPTSETAKKAAKTSKDAVGKNVEKVKKAGEATTETAAEVADELKKQTKAAADKTKKVAKSKAPSSETPADVADAVRKEAKAATEKAKKAAKPKEAELAVKHKDAVKKTKSTEEKSKPEAPKSKKRKAPSGDAETVKADILDPLAEHAEASSKKKQKKEKAKTKSIGDTVGGLLSSAAEGANAARASLGGLASSLMGAAAEIAEGAGDATESAKSVAQKAKGKGKAIAKDVAESSGKTEAAPEADTGADEGTSESDAEPDDHTAALLAGFESEGDEAPGSGQGFEEGQKVPGLPEPKAEELAKKLKDIKAGADEGAGVIYVGRIPHGFYEHEMREYFSQFGDINRLRLSRNRKTGASKHFSFIEFKSASVAKIAAETMDNYLMFGHLLKCKVVPAEQLHEDVWKGADKRFKKVPWNKLEGRKHEMPVGRDRWNARIEAEEERRQSKKEKLKQIGYEFEAPPLKSVDQVLIKEKANEIEGKETVEEEKSLVTGGGLEDAGPMVISEEVKTKKTKKSAKGEPKETTETIVKKTKRTLESGEEAAESVAKKVKKVKKT